MVEKDSWEKCRRPQVGLGKCIVREEVIILLVLLAFKINHKTQVR